MILVDQLYALYLEAPENPARQAALYDELCKLSLGIIYKHLRQRREDLAADAASQVMMNLVDFKGGSAFATWVYKIALNVARMDWRKRRREVPLEDNIEWLSNGSLIGRPGVIILSTQLSQNKHKSSASNNIMLSNITQLLEAGLTLKEISTQLKLPRTTLWRRLRQLQKLLQ